MTRSEIAWSFLFQIKQLLQDVTGCPYCLVFVRISMRVRASVFLFLSSSFCGSHRTVESSCACLRECALQIHLACIFLCDAPSVGDILHCNQYNSHPSFTYHNCNPAVTGVRQLSLTSHIVYYWSSSSHISRAPTLNTSLISICYESQRYYYLI